MFVANIGENKTIGISMGDNNEIKITRLTGSTAFVGEKELLFGNNSGLYNSLISGKEKSVESSDGKNTNIQNYVDKQDLMSLIDGLSPEQIREAQELIKNLIKDTPSRPSP